MATMTINNQGNLISVEIGANVGYFAISDIPEIFSINKDTLQVKSRFYLPYMQAELPLSEISINGSVPADVSAFDAALATLSTVATSGGSGVSSLFPTTGTGTATGDVTGDLASNTLSIINGNVGIGGTPDANQLFLVKDGSNNWLELTKQAGEEQISLYSHSSEIPTGFGLLTLLSNSDNGLGLIPFR